MPRSPKTPLHILLVHGEAASAVASTVQAARHTVKTAGQMEEAARFLGRERFDLVIAPPGEVGPLASAAHRHGVPLWIVGSHEALSQLGEQAAAVDEFLQSPIVPVVLRRRLALYQERRDFYRRQTQLENLLRENASQDPLTRLPNRHFAMQHLQLQWQLFRRKMVPFCCILCDLDEFKRSNDDHGQRFGDKILRAVAHVFKSKLRASDLVCRYDGQQFFILCSDTEVSGARQLAERLRLCLTHLDLPKEVHLTASFSIVQSDSIFNSPDHMLKAAEDALAEAKQYGPNQVVSSIAQQPQ
ncbi:MAG: GGDEF domain-containing protein [Candidatus Eremiobacteraeota bacterium]|nr:GGDEF domain-containing protein [Candidatus Eremiobacteraeota bacterium]MCW5866568.1 GGDEF domain-containing protein [Candidatus Eremiobacteraeota bacterium]